MELLPNLRGEDGRGGNMRLSDVDALKQTFCAECVRTQCKDCNINYHFEHLAPTVDAVKVVRCKDCWYYATGWCRKWLEWSDDDNGFCSWGESK